MKYEELMEQLDNEIVKYYCSTKKYDLYVSFMGDVIKVHKNTHKVSKLMMKRQPIIFITKNTKVENQTQVI